MAEREDQYEVAALQVLEELREQGGIEFVSTYGSSVLQPRVSALFSTHSELSRAELAEELASLLTDQDEVADLFASDKELEEIVSGALDRSADGELSAEQARNPELEAKIAADPDNRDLHLIYADWLQDEGYPRGEFIELQTIAAQTSSPEDCARATKFLRDHGAYLLGQLELVEGVHLEWYLGFIRSASLTAGTDASHLRTLFELPTATLMHALSLGPFGKHNAAVFHELHKILGQEKHATLRSLALEADSDKITSNVAVLVDGLPALRTLYIRGGPTSLEGVRSNTLRELTLTVAGTSARTLRALAQAELPALTHAGIRLLDEVETNSKADLDEHLRPLLQGRGLPKLAHLQLSIPRGGDQLVDLLARTPLIAQLESLDLSYSGLTDAGAALLARSRDRFAHLKRLTVTNNYLSQSGLDVVADVCEDVVAAP